MGFCIFSLSDSDSGSSGGETSKLFISSLDRLVGSFAHLRVIFLYLYDVDEELKQNWKDDLELKKKLHTLLKMHVGTFTRISNIAFVVFPELIVKN